MSTLRVSTSNVLETATLKNGTGGGAPAREEDATHLMERVVSKDRHTLWATTTTPPSPLNVDFHWSSNRTIEVVGALNLIASIGAVAALTVSAQAGAYTPGGSFTTIGTVSLLASPRDAFIVPASAAWRTLRFAFTGTGSFALGRLWAGTLTDLGTYPAPDYVEAPERAGDRVRGPLGQLFGVDYGLSRNDAGITLAAQSAGSAATWRALADSPDSFLYLNHRDVGMEARVLPGDLSLREQFNALYGIDVRLTQMV